MATRRFARGLLCAAVLATAMTGARPAAGEALPSYDVDLTKTSVSGLSSGAFMAAQFHVAFSEIVMAAGIVAGGPYDCAEGLLSNALSRCMKTILGEPDAAQLFAIAQGLADAGRIDPLENLADDKVYVFSGAQDDTVLPAVVAQTAAFYRLAGLAEGNIDTGPALPAGHAMITEAFGSACTVTQSPFINDCDYDQAGAILEHIYGTLKPPEGGLGGRIVAFDQGEFVNNPPSHSMNEQGFAYVPESCTGGARCRVHVAFHGCRQTTADIGDAFYTRAGYNEWADENDIIVLYPQAWAGPGNPNGCWDWWGYDSPNYHVKTGPQMAAVRAMVDRLAGIARPDGEFCDVYVASNYAHWLAERARICQFWFFCAVGSGDNLGFMFATTTLYEHPEDIFSMTPCGN